MEGFAVGTAPGVVFASRDEVNAHYRTDWHRYNLKRKVAGLPPVNKGMFERLSQAADRRAQGNKNAAKKKDHIKKGKKGKAEKTPSNQDATASPHVPASEPLRAPATSTAESEVSPTGEAATPTDVDTNDQTPNTEDGDAQELFDEEKLAEDVDPTICIFDGKKLPSLEENLAYMQSNFGFFVPDTEYVSDLPGLFQYCAKKVNVGQLCIFCDRHFQSAMACKQHMVAMSHCKIRWEAEEDMEEYDMFYDFTASWQPAGEEVTEDMEVEGDSTPTPKTKAPLSMEVVEGGELLFKDANGVRRIGVRHFQTVYKQRYQPEDNRDSVRANARERLLLCYRQAGVSTSSALSTWRYQQNRQASAEMMRKQGRTNKIKQRHDVRQGMQNNLLVKNRVAGKNLGAGFGVHG